MSKLLRFHASLHARAITAVPGAEQWLRGVALRPLEAPSSAFVASFEEVTAELEKLPRMFTEPDGSFVWVGAAEDGAAWQVEGALHDKNGRLQRMDLWGSCPEDKLDDLLRAVGWPGQSVMLQSVREALFLDDADFRRFAAASSA